MLTSLSCFCSLNSLLFGWDTLFLSIGVHWTSFSRGYGKRTLTMYSCKSRWCGYIVSLPGALCTLSLLTSHQQCYTFSSAILLAAALCALTSSVTLPTSGQSCTVLTINLQLYLLAPFTLSLSPSLEPSLPEQVLLTIFLLPSLKLYLQLSRWLE